MIGIVRDFNFHSLHSEISSLALRVSSDPHLYASIKISTQNVPQTLNSIINTFKNFEQTGTYDYYFFDAYFENLYRAEENFSRIIRYFTMLAIIISALGLFGLAFFITEGRTKEIGIRKVVGATVPGITLMLSKDFVKWVLVANIIAWPAAYFFIDRWLQNFAYRTDIDIWIFVLSGVLALSLALICQSYQSIKTAMANPVTSLRYE